jgi:elongation factor G
MGPVLEPYIQLRITVPEDSLGKIVKDLTESNGEVLDLAGSGVGGIDEDGGGYSSDNVYLPPDWLSPSASGAQGGVASDRALRRRAIHAIAPLGRMLDYSNRLRALSGGHGLFEMANAGFREVSDARKLEILREIGRA